MLLGRMGAHVPMHAARRLQMQNIRIFRALDMLFSTFNVSILTYIHLVGLSGQLQPAHVAGVTHGGSPG